jgi:diguanylate cyclase
MYAQLPFPPSAVGSDPGRGTGLHPFPRSARGGAIEDGFCADLYERHFTFKRIQDAVIETGGAMSRELGVVVRTLEDVERDTAAYGEALAGASGALETPTDENSLRRMVEGLVSATARMQRRSRELERRLQETSSEVDQLRDNLE